jgi:hypothetical protein
MTKHYKILFCSLRENPRSESEKSFDNKSMNLAHKQNLDKAYNSPQNRGIAQSFRYMRNKPTIIAFKTPSLESYEASKENGDNGLSRELKVAHLKIISKFNFYRKMSK